MALRIFPTAAPLKQTPWGRNMAMVPSTLQWVSPCYNKDKTALLFGASAHKGLNRGSLHLFSLLSTWMEYGGFDTTAYKLRGESTPPNTPTGTTSTHSSAFLRHLFSYGTLCNFRYFRAKLKVDCFNSCPWNITAFTVAGSTSHSDWQQDPEPNCGT